MVCTISNPSSRCTQCRNVVEWVLVLTVLGVIRFLFCRKVVLWKLWESSESDIALDLSGNYKHYDNVGNDLKLVTAVESKETNNHVISSHLRSSLSLTAQRSSTGHILEKSNTPTLKRAVSCDSIMSNSSVAAEALESPHHCGEIELGLEYDTETEDLIVIINRARDLVGPIPNSIVDSYIKVFLLPDRSTNMQTRIQRKSNNPVFKERFLFGVDEADISQRSLLCTVFTCDKYTNSMLGESEIKLSDVDLAQPYMGWFPIVDSNQGPAELGDIMFSLSYLPTAERLTVVIVKGRNLRWDKSNNTSEFNPFVKVYLLQNGNKFAKKKTSVKKNERDPNFNEAMIFSVPSNALQNMQLRITVADAQSSGKSPPVGHVFVGPYCKGKSLSHWNQMMSSLRKPVAMWHPLRKTADF
ncbi:synaptotagmin-12 [Trichonephila inaurata madagascariensis]|uniref:Synaptotagmin-12 n=1 Tax=Trichonephila inaurata madagascariensis TaxID=2747483 RepID=A0A8X6XMV5_9ARAC|nr:synaptotagmin-12 [Trichonephila inaurata madagascariensis]